MRRNAVDGTDCDQSGVVEMPYRVDARNAGSIWRLYCPVMALVETCSLWAPSRASVELEIQVATVLAAAGHRKVGLA